MRAPNLLRFEMSSTLAQTVAAGLLPVEDLSEARRRIDAVPIILHQLEGSAKST